MVGFVGDVVCELVEDEVLGTGVVVTVVWSLQPIISTLIEIWLWKSVGRIRTHFAVIGIGIMFVTMVSSSVLPLNICNIRVNNKWCALSHYSQFWWSLSRSCILNFVLFYFCYQYLNFHVFSWICLVFGFSTFVSSL